MKQWTYSHSQISTYLQCPMKYYRKYIEGWYDPNEDFTAANKGNTMQRRLESYWENGHDGSFWHNMFDLLPEKFRGEDLESNKTLYFEYNNYKFVAKLDAYIPGTIFELKTTNKLQDGTWQHQNNFQIPLYAKAIMENYNYKFINSLLVVIQEPAIKNFDRAKPENYVNFVEKIWNLNEVEDLLQPYFNLVEQMEDMRQNKNTPYKNYQGCKYCPYKQLCAEGDPIGLLKKEKE